MIRKLLISFLPILMFAIFTGEQMSDNGKAAKTGSPGELFCTDCHDSYGLNSGTGSIAFLNTGMASNQYVPGQTYNMTVRVSHPGLSLFGIGIEALTTTNNNAGTLNITDAVSTVIKSATVAGVSRRNVVHKKNGGAVPDTKDFNFSWTAPATGTGNVTVYFAGVAANGNDNDNLDYVYASNQVLTEQTCQTPVQPNIVNGSTSVCEGTTTTYSVPVDSNATTYTWTLPSGWSGTSTSETINVTSGMSGGTISVTADNSCGSSPAASIAVSVNMPAIPTITLNNDTLQSSAASSYQWYLNGAIISGWVNSFCVPQQNGNYTVEIVDANGCSAASIDFSVTTVGVSNIEIINQLTISPNPASDKINVQAGKIFSNSSITIFDISGKSVLQMNLQNGENSIDLSELGEGVYNVVAGEGKNKIVRRILVSR